jgi:hypothetical protein
MSEHEATALMVYAIWDHADYYGPDLEGIFATRELAEAAKMRLNESYVNACRSAGVSAGAIPADWPHSVEEHEVATGQPPPQPARPSPMQGEQG